MFWALAPSFQQMTYICNKNKRTEGALVNSKGVEVKNTSFLTLTSDDVIIGSSPEFHL